MLQIFSFLTIVISSGIESAKYGKKEKKEKKKTLKKKLKEKKKKLKKKEKEFTVLSVHY